MKDMDMTVQCLEEIVSIASYVYDLEMLSKVFHTLAVVFLYFEQYKSALSYFKKMRSVASELGLMNDKILAYYNMGKCYNSLKDY